jgi:hypothetical protein
LSFSTNTPNEYPPIRHINIGIKIKWFLNNGINKIPGIINKLNSDNVLLLKFSIFLKLKQKVVGGIYQESRN